MRSALFLLICLFPIVGKGQVLFEQRQDITVLDENKNFILPWIGGLNASQYNKADLDGDDLEELILYDRSANIYQIFRQEEGTFLPANELCALLPQVPAVGMSNTHHQMGSLR